ncbi:unnamed protein product [Cunninghamella blakesleeana]
MATKHRTRLPSAVSNRPDASESATIGSRQRQSKKDEQIRRKLEQELSKKKQSASKIRHSRKMPGTVSALRPTQALTVKEHLLVIEAAQLMAAKRGDCVLVVDENDHLSGIFTAKDLAYRVVADGLDPRSTTVSNIMTKMPMCVTADTNATDALNLMVSRGFRHLPVCNDEGDIFGLLDITKCFYEALDKMERAFGTSQKLYDALQGVEREWSNGPVQLVQYMENLRDRMSCPDLNSVLDGSAPAEVNVKTNVREVARIMKDYHTTAVLVTEKGGGLAGIFTTKDIVLRVIAAGLSPDNCSVIRVMTPNPDCANPQTTIMEALRRMHDGHYLNLPVIDEGSIVGVVDVLKLTYVTLEQINSIQGSDGEGPMWSRFWDSFGGNDGGDTESQLSDAYSSSQHHANNNNHHHANNNSNHSHLQPGQYKGRNAISPDVNIQEFPEITPNESASMVLKTSSNHVDDSHSATSSSHRTSHTKKNQQQEEDKIAFKYKLPNGQSHRFNIPEPTYQHVIDTIRTKVITEHLVSAGLDEDDGSSDWLTVSYVDDEGDEILMSSDADVTDALQIARKMGQDRIKLVVIDRMAPTPTSTLVQHDSSSVLLLDQQLQQPLKSPTTPTPPYEENHSKTSLDENRSLSREISKSQHHHKQNEENNNEEEEEDDSQVDDDDDEDEEEDYKTSKKSKRSIKRRNYNKPVEIAGIPQELLLPAAIAFLGVTILGVFILSRSSKPPTYR